MTKNKIFAIVLSVVCLLMGIFATSVYAAECSPETNEKKRELLDQNAKTAVRNMNATYQNFKSAAESYIKSCNPNMKQRSTPLVPSTQMAKVAQRVGESMIPGDKFASYNYDWASETNETSDTCKTKLQMAKSQLTAFEQSYGAAAANLSAAGANDGSGGDCTCDENGQNPTCTSLTSDGSESIEQSGACLPFTGYLNEFTAKCPLCAVFEVILNTDSQLSTVAWNAVAKPLSNVVKIFFLVLLALEALKAVGAMAGAKISSLLKGVFTIGLKIAITVLLLSNPRYIYDLFIGPAISGGLDTYNTAD